MGRPQTAAQKAASRLGGLISHGTPEQAEQARRDLAEVKLADHIREVVDAAPPLTAAQRERLALLLNPAGATSDAGT